MWIIGEIKDINLNVSFRILIVPIKGVKDAQQSAHSNAHTKSRKNQLG